MEQTCAIFIFMIVLIVCLWYKINILEGFVGCSTRPAVLDEWKETIPNWNKLPDRKLYTLVDKEKVVTSYGTSNPLKTSPMFLEYDKDIVTVDGTDKSPSSMAVFSYNRSSPECCKFGNGGYSTDRGCVCITPNQEQWFQNVGNNRQAGYLGL